MARLLCAKDIPGTPYLHIPAGQLESRAQMAKLLNSLEPLSGILGQVALTWYQQIGICLVAVSAYPPPELI